VNPRDIIREAASEEAYEFTSHCLEEMDKDGISAGQVECRMGDAARQNMQDRP